MDNRFYVYEWYNKDTGEVFYVGKGTADRYKSVTGRNNYFLNYYNKHNCDVRKIKDNLLEDEAFELEIDTIAKYRSVSQCKCNLSNGGEGCTFPEGSWNDIYRKLLFMNNVKGYMDDMPNEEDYETNNLKKCSLAELNKLREEYYDFKSGMKTAMELGLIKELDGYELKTVDEEIKMLTRMLIKDIADRSDEFKEVLECKELIDFMCLDIDVDNLLNELLGFSDYYLELANSILYILRFMKSLNYRPDVRVPVKIKSFNITGRYLNVKFKDDDVKGSLRVKVDLYDIVWGLFTSSTKALYSQLYDHIIMAEIL